MEQIGTRASFGEKYFLLRGQFSVHLFGAGVFLADENGDADGDGRADRRTDRTLRLRTGSERLEQLAETDITDGGNHEKEIIDVFVIFSCCINS